ncbi:MAG: hypothetical protein A2992_06875 [Elusimicrobia bacterium RIFCSPLOWO2_01_FULL_59_12]|nr:MAG: hypothetical protein A2992_06875 [Elusimicrobia bacterium RIFCSPLOWO2_01_FULL_59_12]
METRFHDRKAAGRRLAKWLAGYHNQQDVVVLGLARGGVVVASEVARLLNLPLDVLVVRKLGTPGQPELAMGAIASGGGQAVNEDVVGALHIPGEAFDAVARLETKELRRREALYRQGRAPLNVRDRTVIVVDDGLATGATMRAAVSSLRRQHPAHLVVAVPVAGDEAYTEIQKMVNEIVCLSMPGSPRGVGASYEDFRQTTDEEVCSLLQATQNRFPLSCFPKRKAS